MPERCGVRGMMRRPPDASSGQRAAAVIWAILALYLLPELVLAGADLGLWGSPYWRALTYQYAGFWAGLLHDWRPNYRLQPWLMFATYGFLHAGVMHLAVNMVALFSLSRPLLRWLDQRRFALLYAVSLIGGAAGFGLLGPRDAPMVGASGALFGLAGAYLAHDLSVRARMGLAKAPVFRSILWLVALNAVLWVALDGQLAWETHLGGFLAGWAFAILSRR